jgi:uncharacterized membrane protein (TIGR02234 family)
MTARRELWLAVALCLLGSAAALWAVRQPWAGYTASEELTITVVRTGVRGTAVAGAVQALAVVGLAGVVAIAATRRVGRVVVGLLVALAGVGVVLAVAHLLGDLSGQLSRASGHPVASGPHWAWPVLALVGGVLMTAGGVLVGWRGRRWAALSSSYQVPAAREAAAATDATDKATWDLLDSGTDPTA